MQALLTQLPGISLDCTRQRRQHRLVTCAVRARSPPLQNGFRKAIVRLQLRFQSIDQLELRLQQHAHVSSELIQFLNGVGQRLDVDCEGDLVHNGSDFMKLLSLWLLTACYVHGNELAILFGLSVNMSLSLEGVVL
ncbi:hypothetical protein Aduo_006560 [Ancylostoma duodenale]